jgi:two-component system, NtrC family, sensor kinase
MTLRESEAQSTVAPRAYLYSADEGDRRVLVVDDDEQVRRLFADYLGERYSCATAADGREALARLSRETFALVISDMQMPGLCGTELLRKITEGFPDTAVIMVSGVGRTQRVLDAVRLGAFDYLVKPCELDVLDLTVERALERRALLRAARLSKLDLERRNEELRESKEKLQHAQAHLVHNEKMASLGHLAAGVAHELNNPAGFIFGNMEILKECAAGLERLLKFYEKASLPPDEAAQVGLIKDEIDYENTLDDLCSIISDCHDGAERIRDVVQNLRTFSRLDEADFKKVDIHEGIDATIRLLSRYYTSGRVELQRDYGELPPVDCYAGQLNQVWMNLLANAAQAVGEGGRVRVSTWREGQAAVVRVSDTGCGIPHERLKNIFDPFFTTKPVGEGTGLGLSVTHSIVERHGGHIEVESLPGQGTTFTVTIPIDASPPDGEQLDRLSTRSSYVY